MEGAKKTKGKQKREIKKIECDKDLHIAFTKRKSGIYKKASELATLCGAQVDVLIFSPTGNSFCYGEPSLVSIMEGSSNQQHPPQDDILSLLMEDQRKLDIDQLNGKNDALVDQLNVEKDREKELDEILKTRNYSKGWWEANMEANMEELNYEQAKEMEASLMELHKKLERELSIKCDQSNEVSPYYNYGSGSNMPEVAFSANKEAHGIGASGSFLPDFAFSSTNVEQTFNLIPSDESDGDISNLAFPPINQAQETKLFFYDPNDSGESAIASLPNNQAQVHSTDPTRSGSDAFAFSPLNGPQGANPFLYNTSNEIGGFSFPPFKGYDPNGGSESAFTSLPNNQAQEVNLTCASGSSNHTLSFSPSNGHRS